MASLETQYENYIKENPTSNYTFDEWCENRFDEYLCKSMEVVSEHEKIRDEILNDPTMPKELKNLINKHRISEKNVIDLTGGKRIKKIDPDTFEVEYE
jgi:hypothetical protein